MIKDYCKKFADIINKEFNLLRFEYIDLGNRIQIPINETIKCKKPHSRSVGEVTEVIIRQLAEDKANSIVINTPNEGADLILSSGEYNDYITQKTKDHTQEARSRCGIRQKFQLYCNKAEGYKFDSDIKDEYIEQIKYIKSAGILSANIEKEKIFVSTVLNGQKRNFKSIKIVDIIDFKVTQDIKDDMLSVNVSGVMVVSY